jgi:hypothetical protein
MVILVFFLYEMVNQKTVLMVESLLLRVGYEQLALRPILTRRVAAETTQVADLKLSTLN